MRYTLTILEEHLEHLHSLTFSMPECEGAAYLLCGQSVTAEETRLLVRDVIPVRDEHYIVREPLRLSVKSDSYVSAAKGAHNQKGSLFFAHSHPGGYPDFSEQDDAEEPHLMEFFSGRIPERLHGSLILIGKDGMRARAWIGTGWAEVTRIRVIGTGFRFIDYDDDQEPVPEFFDRQVRAFGQDIQRLLGRLHVGVVGAGGTGSATIEQLARLGVGTISVFDHDNFERSNINRVYGSTVADEGMSKADISGEHIEGIGIGTKVLRFGSIALENNAKHLRDCDLVFGCTDNEAPRGILVQLALRYLIPLIDVGVLIDSEDGVLKGIAGRVTTFYPGVACLFCRKRISAKAIQQESLSALEREGLAREGYAPELRDRAPAVIPFTTAVAAQAITELLHRLTGFMGSDRKSTEILLFFHASEIKRNSKSSEEECLCTQKSNWGRGDSRDFLGMVWGEWLE